LATSPGPDLWLVRHGETEWSRSGRHTSRTDLPLTDSGVVEGRALRPALGGLEPALVLSSPLRRAVDTAALAGFDAPVIDPDLLEWNYGDYEGMTTAEIRAGVPGWTVWSAPCPGGEVIDEVSERVDRVLQRVRQYPPGSRVIAFGHGHCLRVLAARWLGTDPHAGRWLVLGAAGLSVLGWEHETAAILHWDDQRHLACSD
jgi:broad specificity phosphatase PhoE